MTKEKRFITPNEAKELLNPGDYIHTFRNPAGMLIGADIKRDKILEILNTYPDSIEIGGSACRGMKHGLIVDDGDYLFIETDMEKLDLFDPPSNPNP